MKRIGFPWLKWFNINELTVEVKKAKMRSGLSCLMLFRIW